MKNLKEFEVKDMSKVVGGSVKYCMSYEGGCTPTFKQDSETPTDIAQ